MNGLYDSGRNFLKANWHLVENGWESDQSKGVPVPPQEEGPKEGERIIPLIKADGLTPRGGSLLDLLRGRKSRRKYSAGSLTLEEFSFLCWAAAGIKKHTAKYSLRTYPSGGARQPLDLFVHIAKVDGLEPGLYRYQPVEHGLVLMRPGKDAAGMDAALNGQYWNSAAVFVWAAVPYRTEWRYGPVSHKIIALDAGHACQNLYLACEAIGCGTCAIGAYDQEKLDAFLGLDGTDRFSLYAAPVGRAD